MSLGVPALRFASAGMTGLKIKRTLRSALVPILATQPLSQLFVRPLGRQVSVFCENGSPRDAAELRT
jgi:hypothetical protein